MRDWRRDGRVRKGGREGLSEDIDDMSIAGNTHVNPDQLSLILCVASAIITPPYSITFDCCVCVCSFSHHEIVNLEVPVIALKANDNCHARQGWDLAMSTSNTGLYKCLHATVCGLFHQKSWLPRKV